jgi:hypothetical protein
MTLQLLKVASLVLQSKINAVLVYKLLPDTVINTNPGDSGGIHTLRSVKLFPICSTPTHKILSFTVAR